MKGIAVDLDGTLLNSQHQLSDENKLAIRRAYAQGICIILATGRTLYSIKEIFAELEVEGYAIALNGSFIGKVDKDQHIEELFRKSVAQKNLIHAFEIAVKEEVTFIVTNEAGSDRVLMDQGAELVQEFLIERPDLRMRNSETMKKLLAKGDTSYLKIAFTNRKREKLEKLREALREEDIDTIFSDTYYIEHLPEGVNKGSALAWLCERLDLPLAEVMAFGDQENDLELIQQSGIGVAMGNAQDQVKAVADRITLANDQNGVAYEIEKMLE